MKTVKTVMVSLVVIALVACNGSSAKQSDEKLIGVWSGYLIDPDTGVAKKQDRSLLL